MKTIYILTNPTLGWDCVVATYTAEEEAEKASEAYGEEAIILESTLEDTYNGDFDE